MEELPVRARITDEITGVIYVMRCERELSPQEVQQAILERKKKTLELAGHPNRGEVVEIQVRAASENGK